MSSFDEDYSREGGGCKGEKDEEVRDKEGAAEVSYMSGRDVFVKFVVWTIEIGP